MRFFRSGPALIRQGLSRQKHALNIILGIRNHSATAHPLSSNYRAGFISLARGLSTQPPEEWPQEDQRSTLYDDDDKAEQRALLEPEQESDEERRIHILGAGNVAIFLAHSLAGIPNSPPVTILVRHAERLANWEAAGRTLKVSTRGLVESRQGFDVQLVNGRRQRSSRSNTAQSPLSTFIPSDQDVSSRRNRYKRNEGSDAGDDTPIHHLIVTVKAQRVVEAIRPLVNRLTPDSTICFMQAGLGIVEEVSKHLFPDESDRPHYVMGVFKHRVLNEKPYHVNYVGRGTLALGLLPPEGFEESSKVDSTFKFPSTTRHILRTITRTPILIAVPVSAIEILQRQLDFIAIMAIIEPLTALFDCENGKLLGNQHVTRVMRLMLAEISLVFRSLPELRGVPNVGMRFDAGRLERRVITILRTGAHTHSTTLMDVRHGSETEIEYVNGYIVKRGEELGFHCVTNYTIMQMVLALTRFSNMHKFGQRPLRKPR